MTEGARYALAALGFTLIYNASGVINFAQGESIMIGGLAAMDSAHKLAINPHTSVTAINMATTIQFL